MRQLTPERSWGAAFSHEDMVVNRRVVLVGPATSEAVAELAD